MAITSVSPPQFTPDNFANEAGLRWVNQWFNTLVQAVNQLLQGSSSSAPSGPKFVDAETPAGTVNGTNKVFTLKNIPNPVSSLIFVADGKIVTPGSGMSLVNGQVTLVTAPATSVVAWYRM